MRNFSTICYLLIIISFFYQSAKAQESSENSNKYFAHLSFKQFDVAYLRNIGKMGLGVKVGYQYPLSKEKTVESNNIIGDFFSNSFFFSASKGFNTDLLINLATSSDQNLQIVSLGYGNISTVNLIEAGGFSSDPYYEYYEEFDVISLKYNFLLKTIDHMFVSFQGGMERRNVTRNYTIEGEYSDRQPSDKVEKFTKYPLVFDVGLVYMLGN